MPPLTVGELQVILSGDTSRLDRDMDRIDNRAGKTEKVHTAAWQRTGVTAGEAIRDGMLSAERDADRIGDHTGGVLAKGMRSGLIRNSPLIAAAIGGALIAGAPLVTAGAVAMFAGVGAVAAAQTVEVRSAWSKLGKDITAGAVADSAVLVPVYVDMADKIGDAFQDLRPQLREAFTDSVPLVGSFTDGVIALGSNAMPGLVRAIAAGGPVFDGLEDFLASTGDGLTGLLDGISSHGPAAGAVFTSLGAILGDLLPILGELLGQGAELAADVLPAVAGATGLALNVLQLLGPLLPPIVAGFVAFKAAQTAAGYLQTFAVQAQYATMAMTGSYSAGTKVGGALSAMGKALPAVGIAFGLAGAQMAMHEAKVTDWTRAILEGGRAAQVAAQQAHEASSGFWELTDSMQFGDQESFAEMLFGADDEERFAEAQKAADDLLDAMSPLELAQQGVTKANNELNEALKNNSPTSDEVAAKSAALTAKQDELARAQGNLELATQGVTAAMITQADQAMAALDSGFAYRNSVDGLEDAQARLAETIKNRTNADEELRTSEEDVARAQLAVEEQAYRTALAFGQQQADLSGLSADSAEYKRLIQEQMLVELQRLHDAAGPEMKAAIAAQIAALQAGGVELSASAQLTANLRGQMGELSGSIHEVPGQKFVKIDAPTAEQKQRLRDLGYTVTTLPDGSIYVSADTAAAEAAIAWATRARRMTITVDTIGGSGVRLGSGMLGGTVLERAEGGGVWPGQTFLVGEEGPELLRFGGAGTVIDAKQTAAMMAAGNAQAAGMLPTVGPSSAGRGMSLAGGSAGTDRASVGGVTKQYNLHATVTHAITPREFVNLQQEADALYG